MKKKHTALIVDDDKLVRVVVDPALYHIFEKVVHSKDGTDAIKIAKLIKPDMIFLDLRLPDISGIELCRQLREIDEIKNSVILMLSGENDAKYINEGMKAGANGYLCKSITKDDLVHYVFDALDDYDALTAA